MQHKYRALLVVAGSFLLGGVAPLAAQDYPTKPITMTITFKAGGAADIAGRLAAAAAEKKIGQPIPVVNKLGGGGAIGFDFVGNQAPDGYNIGWLSASILTTTQLGQLPYDYQHFEYVCGVTFDATAIAVRADAPWKTLQEFLAAVKAKPKELKIGDAGAASFTYMVASTLMKKQGVEPVFVPVGERRLPALLSGEVDAISVHPPEIIGNVKSGEIRMLAISSPKRVEAFPDVPTLGEFGMEVGFYQFRGIFVPKGTPQAIKVKLADAFKEAENDPKLKEAAKQRGFGVNYIGLDKFPEYVGKQNALIKEAVAAAKKSASN